MWQPDTDCLPYLYLLSIPLLLSSLLLAASGKVKEILAPHENVLQVTFHDKAVNTESLLNEDGIELVEILSNNSVVITLKNRDAVWLNKLLLDRGYQVSALTPKQKTLKEFFLSVTGEKNNG